MQDSIRRHLQEKMPPCINKILYHENLFVYHRKFDAGQKCAFKLPLADATMNLQLQACIASSRLCILFYQDCFYAPEQRIV